MGSTSDLARLAGAQKDDTARVLHWLENEGVIRPQAGPDHRPLAGCAQGASRLSRGRVAAWACLALTLSAGATGARAQFGRRIRSRSTRASPARAPRCWSWPTSRCCPRTAGRGLDRLRPRARDALRPRLARAALRARPGGTLGLSNLEPDRLRPLHSHRAGLRVGGRRGGADVGDRRIPGQATPAG